MAFRAALYLLSVLALCVTERERERERESNKEEVTMAVKQAGTLWGGGGGRQGRHSIMLKLRGSAILRPYRLQRTMCVCVCVCDPQDRGNTNLERETHMGQGPPWSPVAPLKAGQSPVLMACLHACATPKTSSNHAQTVRFTLRNGGGGVGMQLDPLVKEAVAIMAK